MHVLYARLQLLLIFLSIPQTFFFNDILIATLFIYLFIFGCVGSSVCARAFSSCGKRGPLLIAARGPLFIAVRGPFTIVAPPVAGHRLQTRRLSSCGTRAQPLRGTWDLPRPGLEPVSPALAGRFSTTAPPGKPPQTFKYHLPLIKSLKLSSFKTKPYYSNYFCISGNKFINFIYACYVHGFMLVVLVVLKYIEHSL